MRPMSVITGVVLGSCLSITVSLAAVLLVFFLLGDDHPRVRHEIQPLSLSTAIFLCMTVISGVSFYSLLVNHKLRYLAQVALWLGLLLTGWYYWP